MKEQKDEREQGNEATEAEDILNIEHEGMRINGNNGHIQWRSTGRSGTKKENSATRTREEEKRRNERRNIQKTRSNTHGEKQTHGRTNWGRLGNAYTR